MILKDKFLFFFVLIFVNLSFAQEMVYNSQPKLMHVGNPSYFGLNSWNRSGLLYNTTQINPNETQNNKFFYGSYSFDLLDFSLGVQFNNFSAPNIGFKKNDLNLSYIYKVELGNNLWFLPSVNVGFVSKNLNPSNLIFEDQINSITGYINQESIDPLSEFFFAKNYTDLGASFLLHNSDFLIGLNFDYLNKPNVAYETDVAFLVPISYGMQVAYEFNLNPYDRRFLPRYSYLYAYSSVRRDAETMNIFSSQEFQLGEFSVGVNQQFGFFDDFSFLNLGLSIGLTYENFDLGVSYAFSVQDLAGPNYRYPPRIFDLHLSFDFSPFLRNRRGQYKRLQIDNYY
jgi:type IX secretion system PorP/SprF family membrane protein